MAAFRVEYDADIFVLRYSGKNEDTIEFVNPDVIEEIRECVNL